MPLELDLMNLVIADVGAIVAICAMVVSVSALLKQRKHNKLSVQPIPEVTVADYEDSIWVRLRNNGTEPLLIRKVSVHNENTSKPTLISWMPSLESGRLWNHFSTDLVGRSLQPGKFIPLAELIAREGEQGFKVSPINECPLVS